MYLPDPNNADSESVTAEECSREPRVELRRARSVARTPDGIALQQFRKEQTFMSHMKSILAVLVLTAIVGVVPQAHAVAPINLQLAGSSAMWQSMALAAYNSGNCLSGATAPCFHWTGASKFNLVDSRPGAGSFITDTGNIWIVWDSAATPNVWAYINVDSVVGQRCYFAHPHCTVSITTFPAAGQLITLPAPIWGTDATTASIPTSVTNLFTVSGNPVNVGTTDIRPEDGLFATCRSNSAIGGGSDGLDGLGYGINTPSGACPTTLNNAHLVGSDILSGYPSSTGAAHIVAYNISGHDPFTNQTIPAATTVSVGASPIVFVAERNHELAGVKDATDAQIQALFSGANCNASAFGLASGTIEAYLREPISGTMNTTEANVFRYAHNVDPSGSSQETGVTTNPLKTACAGGGGSRFRAIGTGEMVKSVLNSFTNNGHDGVGYAFFSYGNVSTIADNSNYGYLTLNGVDPIWHVYGATGVDPGQSSTAGNLPGVLSLPGSCSSNFPCAESVIWGSSGTGNHGVSFPNVRNGSYRAWSILRIVSDGTALTHARTLATKSQSYNVTTVPDYVPAIKTIIAGGQTDPGLLLLRSHYQETGGGVNIGPAPINIAATGDKGGDVGGCILMSNQVESNSDTTVQLAQAEPENHCVVLP
jgi:hypothetical protein